MAIKLNHDTLPRSPYVAYLQESRKPVVCLAFTLPFFLLYHVGVWAFSRSSDRILKNGADVILDKAFNFIGVGTPLISLIFVIMVFLLLQQAQGSSWKVRPRIIFMMLIESVIVALPPFVLGKVLHYLLQPSVATPPAMMMSTTQNGITNWAQQIILSMGAGVYEEFLFRMLLMGALFWVGKNVLGIKGSALYAGAMLIQALLFAGFHHLPGSGEPLRFELFAFRTVAGVYFAYLYQERGFGIAGGSHACYDVIAVTLNALR